MTTAAVTGSPTLPLLWTPAGERLVLERELGRGGEARVYSLVGESARALKLYSRDHPERAAKLRAMLAKVPADPDRRHGHVSIAWPEALALDDAGRVRGFVMPRIDTRRYLPLHQLYHPRSRRERAPGISWRYLVRIARNLCATLAALHEADYVVGDLNESNILVDDRALVTLVDLDSIQVKTITRVFRCPVGKVEYTPPELQGRSFRDVSRRRAHDRFSLAVLVFLLLMEGNHPFSGVHAGKGEPPGLEDNIASRRSPWFGRSTLTPPLGAPPLEILGADLAAVLGKALVGRAWLRSSARDLQKALESLEESLRQCDRVNSHVYRNDLTSCPWCFRAAALGMESFPLPGQRSVQREARGRPHTVPVPAGTTSRSIQTSPGTWPGGSGGAGGQAPSVAPARPASPPGRFGPSPARLSGRPNPPAPTTPPPAAAGFQGSWLRFHRGLPVSTLTLLAVLASPAVLWRAELMSLSAELGLPEPVVLAAPIVAALLPPLAVSFWFYRQAVTRPARARLFLSVERLLRALLMSTVAAFVVSWLAGAALGFGWVLAGDWRVFPPTWLLTFLIALRFVGPKRY